MNVHEASAELLWWQCERHTDTERSGNNLNNVFTIMLCIKFLITKVCMNDHSGYIYRQHTSTHVEQRLDQLRFKYVS